LIGTRSIDLLGGNVAIAGRWQLHPLHLYLVRVYLGIGDLTLPLEGPAYGRTLRQLGEIGKREAPTMERLGILVDDEVHPGLKAALEVLAKPYLWMDSLWFPVLGEEAAWRVVAAQTDGDRVVLGVQGPGEDDRFGGVLTVEVHEKTPLPQVLLATFPAAPPGRRPTVRVPESSFRSDEQQDEPPESYLQQAQQPRMSSGDRQLAAYRELAATAHARAGQFAANRRDPHGLLKRSSVVRWFDNPAPDGRYLDYAEPGSTGETMHVAEPADARRVRSKLEELLNSVR
jgi:hypothetical protein